MGCAGLAILGLPFYMARDVAVDASRGSGQLVITRTYPLLGPRREVLPRAGIRAAGLRSRTTKNGPPVFGVTLLTDAGERDIAEGRTLGDTSTLADAAVVDTIREHSGQAED